MQNCAKDAGPCRPLWAQLDRPTGLCCFGHLARLPPIVCTPVYRLHENLHTVLQVSGSQFLPLALLLVVPPPEVLVRSQSGARSSAVCRFPGIVQAVRPPPGRTANFTAESGLAWLPQTDLLPCTHPRAL